MKIRLTLDKLDFEVSLFTDAAPLTCQALVAALPIERKVIHAMWSGHQIIALPINLQMASIENPIAMSIPGDVLYHQHHHEIAVVYGEAQFREPIGPVYVTRIGHIQGNLDALATLGEKVQMEGAKSFRLYKESK